MARPILGKAIMVATWPAAHPESGALSGWIGRRSRAAAGLDVDLADCCAFVTGTDVVIDGALSLG